MPMFFPSSPQYDDVNEKYNIHKKFWRRALQTKAVREKAEQARREVKAKERLLKRKGEQSSNLAS